MERRAAFWAILTLAYLGLGVYWTWQAPFGSWENYVFGFDLWIDNDPGGWYITAAHDLLVQPDRVSWPEHPGLPLTLLLAPEQRAIYFAGRLSGTDLDFTSYIARNVGTVWIVARLIVILMHIGSFVALYHFARVLLRRTDLALVAVGLYATSFPVLYYLNRVSIEPFMIIFFFATIVCIAKAEQADARQGRLLLWAGFAGVCAVSALFTKISMMAAWPAFAGACLLTGTEKGSRPSWRSRVFGVAAFVVGGAGSAAFFSLFMDWSVFARTWNHESLRPVDAELPAFFWRMPWEVATGFVHSLRTGALEAFPAATREGFFSYFEFLFFVAALVGLVQILRQNESRRRLLGWILAFCVFVVCVWWYRAAIKNLHGFHYLFPIVAAASPLAAAGLARVIPGVLVPTRTPFFAGLVTLASCAALHYASIFAVVDSKRQDHAAFLRIGSAYHTAALRRVGKDERIGVIGRSAYSYHGLSDSYALPGHRSGLVLALEDLFFERDSPVGCEGFTKKARQRGVEVVVAFDLPDPRPRTLSEWDALPQPRRCVAATAPTAATPH